MFKISLNTVIFVGSGTLKISGNIARKHVAGFREKSKIWSGPIVDKKRVVIRWTLVKQMKNWLNYIDMTGGNNYFGKSHKKIVSEHNKINCLQCRCLSRLNKIKSVD